MTYQGPVAAKQTKGKNKRSFSDLEKKEEDFGAVSVAFLRLRLFLDAFACCLFPRVCMVCDEFFCTVGMFRSA